MSLRVYYEVLNQRGTPALFTDTLANRPAFGFQGRLFISTDSGQIFEDTGTAWTLVADAGVGGGTLSSVCLNGNTTATGIVITAGGLTANAIIKSGGTASEFLKANGSVDSNTYLTTSAASSTYLPLAGGTLTGGLIGTTGTFSGIVTTPQVKASTSAGLSINANSGTQVADFGAGGSANITFFGGLSGTSASFSSSVTGNTIVKTGGTASEILSANGSVITAGTNITISGGTISSSATGMAIGGSITSATAGSVLFAGASGVLNQDNANLFWDDTNNRLGIGTNSPTTTLSINGALSGTSATFSGSVNIGTAGSEKLNIFGAGSQFINVKNTTSGADMFVGMSSALSAAFIGTGGTDPIVFSTAGSEKARITSGGNVGIGTSSPNNTTSGRTVLDINGTSTSWINQSVGGSTISYIGANSTNAFWNTDGAYFLAIGTNNTERMRITSGGNVLIGTTTDNGQGKLQVNGIVTAVNGSFSGETIATTSTSFNTTFYHIISAGIPAGQTYTLPTPATNNYQYVIVNKTAFPQTIAAFSGFTIYNLAGTDVSSITLASKGKCYIIADGSGYYQIY